MWKCYSPHAAGTPAQPWHIPGQHGTPQLLLQPTPTYQFPFLYTHWCHSGHVSLHTHTCVHGTKTGLPSSPSYPGGCLAWLVAACAFRQPPHYLLQAPACPCLPWARQLPPALLVGEGRSPSLVITSCLQEWPRFLLSAFPPTLLELSASLSLLVR